jgi:hypothetical protein
VTEPTNDLAIARDDIALSAIANGAAPGSDDPTLLLLASFRADLDEAVAEPLRVTSTVVPLRPRRRRAGLIALSAAAGIAVGGLTAGAVAVADRPGESLYAVHAAVFGKAETRTEDVTALLDQAAGMLARGDRPAARRLLGQAASLIPNAPETEQARLRARLDDLTVYAAEPARPSPAASPSPTRTREATPEPSESEDRSGSNSGSGGSGSDSSGSGSGSDDATRTIEPSDGSGSGSGSSSGSGGSSGGSGSNDSGGGSDDSGSDDS